MIDLDTNTLITELKGVPAPNTMDGLARFLVELMQPMIDEVKALREMVSDLESKGLKYCGTWERAIEYQRGSVITDNGSAWVALEKNYGPDVRPGASPRWQLLVKSGKDAR